MITYILLVMSAISYELSFRAGLNLRDSEAKAGPPHPGHRATEMMYIRIFVIADAIAGAAAASSLINVYGRECLAFVTSAVNIALNALTLWAFRQPRFRSYRLAAHVVWTVTRLCSAAALLTAPRWT